MATLGWVVGARGTGVETLMDKCGLRNLKDCDQGSISRTSYQVSFRVRKVTVDGLTAAKNGGPGTTHATD